VVFFGQSKSYAVAARKKTRPGLEGARVTNEHRDGGLAGRYATAVLELAQEEKSVESVERDFEALKGLIADSTDLRNFIHSPIFSRAEHAKAMKAVLQKIEAGALTSKFVLTLASKRRLFALTDIIRSFMSLLARQRGEVQAQVISARALSEAEIAELKAVIKSKLGRDPRIETRIDPTLLGGLVVQIGSRMIDSSLRTKLHGIRMAMRGG
jgi:F-type H+-transporting ATPase subunit delta